MNRLLFACAAGASAFQVEEPQRDEWRPSDPARILLFGSSVDRNAIDRFCGDNLEVGKFLQTRWCHDKDLKVRMGFIFHPGVGYHGDLHGPFHLSYGGDYGTGSILKNHANSTSWAMLGGGPHVVVVDSSLWDLAVWRQEDGKKASSKRVGQWCQHDLPHLLKTVAEKFSSSRIVFRTAPTIGKPLAYGSKGYLEKFSKEDIELLYVCITSSMVGGKLFGKYEVIDYYAIMQNILVKFSKDAFLYDGFHPGQYASDLYVNDVLRLVGVKRPDPPEPHSEETNGASPSKR